MRESDLLRHIYEANAELPRGVLIPPGDDMGAVEVAGGRVLVTVDQVADGVHFDLKATPLDKIGRKAITRSLSDAAAMAVKPIGAVAAACLPRDFEGSRADELFDAMRLAGEAYGCPIFGGDISMWDQRLIITVTVLGEAWPGVEPVRRSGAKAGDVIFVTGKLGGSMRAVHGYTHHLDFEPRIGLAYVLAGDAKTRPNCLIDLSDGLAKDLGHLCEAAGLSAEVDAARLPVSEAAQAAAKEDGRPAWQHAMGDGEDYELCFTVSREQAESLPAEIEGVAISRIGVITDRHAAGSVWVRLPDGKLSDVTRMGWEHQG